MGATHSDFLKQTLQGLIIPDKDVINTDELLGHGAYGSVSVVKVYGLRCACKKLHDVLAVESSADNQYSMVQRFVDECIQMSKMRHPNIVQFLGVYFGKSSVPSLVMELLPISLGEFLDDYPNVPDHVKNSILHDVALGLLYMHQQNPPMIHRDLTVSNVLLTKSLKAKITDLGVAKVLSSTRSSSSRRQQLMSINPGNAVCMPPEARVENPIYDSKLDNFSFGHMIVHVVIQRWPMPLPEFYYYDYSANEKEKFQRTEIQRREEFIAQMRNGDPLRDLATRCLQDDPMLRPTTEELVREMERLCLEKPPKHSSPAEIINFLVGRQVVERDNLITAVSDLNHKLSEKTQALEEAQQQVRVKQRELEAKDATIENLEAQLEEKSRNPRVSPTPVSSHHIATPRNIPPMEDHVPIPRPRVSRPSREVSPDSLPHCDSKLPDDASQSNGVAYPQPKPRFAHTQRPVGSTATLPRTRKAIATDLTTVTPTRADELTAVFARWKQISEKGDTETPVLRKSYTARPSRPKSTFGERDPIPELQRKLDKRRSIIENV